MGEELVVVEGGEGGLGAGEVSDGLEEGEGVGVAGAEEDGVDFGEGLVI